MKLELKDFQRFAVDELTRRIRKAQLGAVEDPQAVVLSAPTGAGKTVIATAMIERLLEGDEQADGDPEVTVLWLTDDPDLNEQTRRKMLAHSSVLHASRLTTIKLSFDSKTFGIGRVYFLNTQKLARTCTLVRRHGDKRTWTLWETLRNTIAARPQSFIVILDEAHRGMAETEADRMKARSIVQKFIKGSEEMPPTPVILGVSATPDRFHNLLEGGARVRHPEVDIPAEEVQGSGLLKESLLVFHPDEKQPANWTLLRTAAEATKEYAQAWKAYRDRTKTQEVVEPVLVVQVENAPGGRVKGRVTKTDFARALSEIEDVLGPLEDHQVGHCFQEGSAVVVADNRVVRYVAPPDVQDDAALKVVFFKTALTTGWDCPRAEVMMSFRKAVDHTLIAQLVGRMVRTPLARRVDDDEFLNTVSLYLPHYDRAGLKAVLDRLAADDPEIMPPITVREGKQRLRLGRNPELDRCFEAIRSVPTYDVARVRKQSDVRRVMKYSRLLARDGIAPDALDMTRAAMVSALQAARTDLEKGKSWLDIVKDVGTIDLRRVEWAVGSRTVSEAKQVIPATQENIEDLFRVAGRALGEGLHKAYWKARAEQDAATVKRIAKLEVFALTRHAETMEQLERQAKSRMEALQSEHAVAVSALPADQKDPYHQVWRTAKRPEPMSMELPEFIEGSHAGSSWNGHLYVVAGAGFPYEFGPSWEPMVLSAAQDEEGFVGWLRNEPRKKWALQIPHGHAGESRPFFPDFLVFREDRAQLVVDILDPHDPSRDDWMSKVQGLAAYAASHWSELGGRIQAIYVEGKKSIRRLDLSVESNREQALSAEGPKQLKGLFS